MNYYHLCCCCWPHCPCCSHFCRQIYCSDGVLSVSPAALRVQHSCPRPSPKPPGLGNPPLWGLRRAHFVPWVWLEVQRGAARPATRQMTFWTLSLRMADLTYSSPFSPQLSGAVLSVLASRQHPACCSSRPGSVENSLAPGPALPAVSLPPGVHADLGGWLDCLSAWGWEEVMSQLMRT